MDNVFVLSHASDIDGVASAALIKIRFDVPLKNIYFSTYSEEGLEYAKEHMRANEVKCPVLFITDMGINERLTAFFKEILEKFRAENGMVVWLDHHIWSDKDIREIAGKCDLAIVGENPKYCATEITRKFLGLEDMFTKKLAGIVHYSDFNITPKDREKYDLIGTYAIAITYYNTFDSWSGKVGRLRKITATLASGRLANAAIKRDRKIFERQNNARIKAMLKSLHYLGSYAALGFAEDVQSTQACAAIMKAGGRDVGIYVNTKRGKGSIRSVKRDISVLARRLGGNGHPHAAGFQIDTRKFDLENEEGREKLLKLIEMKLKK